MPEIYKPAEDSYFLIEVLQDKLKLKNHELKNLKFLEMGCGSGIILQFLKSIGVKNLFGIDINPDAVKQCKTLGFKCIVSDLFNEIQKNEKFDVIIFNPPYLPENPKEPEDSKLATTGGKKGSEIINEFLKQAKKHLKKHGKIFLLFSSFTKGIKWQGFKKKILAKKKLFFEELYVVELAVELH